MRFYSDENFPQIAALELEKFGHDIMTAFADGKANQEISDEEVLARAMELERVVLTLNRLHFKRLHKFTSNHFGIVICTYDPDFLRQAARIHEKISEYESLKGKLIRVYRPDK